jgi:tetratricopeptide (TPR) repeat protein
MAHDGLLLCHGETGLFRRALDDGAAALAILEQLDDGEAAMKGENLRALLFLHAGWVHAQLGQNEEALESLRAGLKLARGLREEELTGFLLNGEAQVLIDVDPARAVEPAAEAVAIGARINNLQLSREANGTLALARLRVGNLDAACEAADAAARYRQGHRAPWALALQGITAFRKGQHDKARLAFLDAHKKAQELRGREGRNFQALDILGLVLCGLALSGDVDGFDPAIGAYRDARRGTREPGPVRRSLHLLDELGAGRGPDELAAVRRAAGGR